MKINEDLRKTADEFTISDEDAIQHALEVKLKKFSVHRCEGLHAK